MNLALEIFAKPLSELMGDEGQRDVSQAELVDEVKQRVQDWKDSVTPEALDEIREEPMIVDALRDLQTAMLNADHVFDPRVHEAICQLMAAHHDEVWSLNGGDEL